MKRQNTTDIQIYQYQIWTGSKSAKSNRLDLIFGISRGAQLLTSGPGVSKCGEAWSQTQGCFKSDQNKFKMSSIMDTQPVEGEVWRHGCLLQRVYTGCMSRSGSNLSFYLKYHVDTLERVASSKSVNSSDLHMFDVRAASLPAITGFKVTHAS